MAVNSNQLWIYHYGLESPAPLNSLTSRRVYSGCLVRIENGGVGCIHPWPELGDASLDEQLDELKSGKCRSANLLRALECAEIDGLARQKGVSLFADREQPRNHWLYRTGDSIKTIKEAGFDQVKLKVGPAMDTKLMAWDGVTLRLDANESFKFQQAKQWWLDLSESIKEVVEFVEDPCPWDRNNWTQLANLGMPLAIDRLACEDVDLCPWKIAKPAVDSVDLQIGASQRLIYTSYMDHPIGQLWAAFRAAGCSEVCGLLTHRCFAINEFSEALRVDEKTRLVVPDGTGLGFDSIIEKLAWKRLN